MKKVLICGATHGSNFGDSLFAYMFKRTIESEYPDSEVYFTKASEYSIENLGLKVAKLKDLLTADVMIYISGGYFGQSHNEKIKQSIHRFLLYFIYGLLMIVRRKPIAILGVGAGPLSRLFLRKAAVYIFNKSKLVSVRDLESRDYMKSYGVKKDIIVTSDSAQVIDNEIFNIGNNPDLFNDKEKLKDKKVVLIHTIDGEYHDLYYEKVISAVKESLTMDENYAFVIAADSVITSDSLNKVYRDFPKDRTIVYEFYKPLDFVEVIANADIVITPKLHVGIIGYTYNKSIFSFPIHPGKTERYFKHIGYPNRCMSLFDVSKEEVKRMINENIDSDMFRSEHIKNAAQKNFDLLIEFGDKYIK